MSQTKVSEKAVALGELGEIFEYPRAEYKSAVEAWCTKYAPIFDGATQSMNEFAKAIADTTDTSLEEIYTRTFDMAPICSPYISGHIYGDENFERGTLLTALNERYQSASFDTHGELPDHLAVILRFAPQMTEEELQELFEFCLSKPLDDMVAGLSGNPYEHAIKAVTRLVHEDGVAS